jgi:hypothetical protein
MAYDAPGNADKLDKTVLAEWNKLIAREYRSQQARFGSRFFSIDPTKLRSPVGAAIQWFADPAEPAFCISSEQARVLSDWGVRGRQVLHNEYCEYAVIFGMDPNGKFRPKRVEITTELREYWLCVATHAPAKLRQMVQKTLGFKPSWEDLYGGDPATLSRAQREAAFSRLVAGTPEAAPTGRLNTEHALFMTHAINGLDDLVYIVIFGARPYARKKGNGIEPISKEELFRKFGVEHLACRHADPAAAMGAAGAAFEGRAVAFANPLGVYIVSFAEGAFSIKGKPIPKKWIRWGRGQAGMYQRLVFGPSDADKEFLDDIVVSVGAKDLPVTGGFQVLQQIEVGPRVLAGATSPVRKDELVVIAANRSAIKCGEADICNQIKELKREHTIQLKTRRTRPRVVGPIG